MTNVKLTFPDGTFVIRSLVDHIDHYKDETPGWQACMYWALLYEKKEFWGRFGVYSLTDEKPTK